MNNTAPSESIDLEFSEPLTGDSFALSHTSLNINNIMDSVRDNGAGALAVFVGTTRDNFNGKQVTRLEYEAYSKLAIKSMAKIATDARNLKVSPHDFGPTSFTPAPTDAASLTLIAIHHRLGEVPVGEASIVIAVTSPHRRESFYVCEWILEQIKMKTPIWKREWYAEGDPSNEAVWKANFPPQKAK
ncbi:molybdenum cofactor biosynthesis protein [Rhizoctonia solani]|uniref:Molybdenum cofactor biosynthesis protein n=1 Tax=Rhizoctonia solani TaxID=456999 RepID=A0A8H8P9I2_9AGAM|nr:molybdenum cofactor biosynthesis protein [Rhizoctonia solani]QRW26286.1 molybdenum cofactor biosynthesis protein [Rhizoctonia solani]